MAIKNKDGSDYKLNGPNPHMKNQLLWDHFELHNMNFEEISSAIKKQKENIKTEEPKKQTKIEEFKELPKLDVSNKNEEIEEKVQINEEEIEVKKEEEQKNNSNVKKINIFCLPAKVKIFEDSLYGEIKKTIDYGKKFKFEAVEINCSDINFEIWTNAVDIEKESILYPQNFEKRWWRVNNITKKFDGILISCNPSKITPSFEDL